MSIISCVALSSMLGGCITETTGLVQPKEQPGEASDLNVQLGVGYLRQGDLQSAQEKLEKAIELNSDNVTAHRVLGRVYELLDDQDAAERYYRRAVSLAPKDPEALNSLAVFLCRSDATHKEALGVFNRAIAVPQSTQLSNKAMLNTNAAVCAESKDLALAEEYLRQALASDNQYSAALLEMGDVSLQRGNYLQARAFLQRYGLAAQVSPSFLWLSYQVETALGDTRAAAKFANELREKFPESAETRLLLESERNAR